MPAGAGLQNGVGREMSETVMMNGVERRVAELRRERRLRWARGLVVAAVVLAGLTAGAYAAALYGVDRQEVGPRSGVRGTVVRVPLESIRSGDVSAGEPVAALVRIADPDGDPYGRTTSDGSGRFQADLLPGRYLLSAMSPVDTALPVSESLEVTVHPGEYTTIWLTLPAAPGSKLVRSPEPMP